MAFPIQFSRLALAVCTTALPLGAQDLQAPELVLNQPSAVAAPAVAADGPVSRNAADGAIFTRKDARTITLKIPAPRGQIVDRDGAPLAQNRVAYQIALQYPQFEKADRNYVVNWARTRLDQLGKLAKNQISKTDDELFSHYDDRRWLPLIVSGQLGDKQALELQSKLPSGLVLQPVYSRVYPEDGLAAHIIGYSGSVGKLPTGPINFNEPLWEETEGRSGLEKVFDQQLTGEPGMKRLLFDENGNKLLEEEAKRPLAGGTLVTTLDLKWQRLAEKTLRGGCRRGAFVVIDAVTGEVLVMASRPTFNLNDFIPGISEADYKALLDDPSQPLFGRAFQSKYPPASAFKPVVALAALNNGTVTEYSTVYCPASLSIGNTTFRNWSKIPEGSINVKRALARSCNTWFYQVGIDVGPTAFLSLARRLGYGSLTGLPLISEARGLVPDNEWMLRNEKRRFLNGDTANLSIGQGQLLASPLQVAQAMACIANGSVAPKLHLIRQVQDPRGRVIKAETPERRDWLGLDKKAVRIVQDGMSDVVNGSGGTGRRGGLSYTELCGKTGTAQWGPKSKEQRLAWFAGFLPRDNPRYAFAVLYEGRPGETVSGGKMAAPMVKEFFEGIKDDIKDTIAPPKKALIVVDESAAAADEETPETPEIPVEDEIHSTDPGVATLRAIPVAPLEIERAVPFEEEIAPEPAEPAPARAIPVGDDEIIQDAIEQP